MSALISRIGIGGLNADFKIGSKFLIRIFLRTFYKNGFLELVKILVIIFVISIGSTLFTEMVILMINFYHQKTFL